MVAIRALGDTDLFKSIKVGANELSHKIVYAPTTRFRALENHAPSDLIFDYYNDRTKYPGSLVITEATIASPRLGVYEHAPGIWTEEQVDAWKKVTDKVHANGSRVSVQLWALGRTADPEATKKAGYPLIAPSAMYPSEDAKKAAEKAGNLVHELTEKEIREIIDEDFVIAAKNAVRAGFDYVEIHGAHGYLIDTFLQESTNIRTDKYGGSIENRSRFGLELVDRLTEAIGAEKLAIRLSPWAYIQGVSHAEGSPVAQFAHFIGELEKRAKHGKRLAYLSVVEPRVNGVLDVSADKLVGDNAFVKTVWTGILIKAGNYTYDAPNFHSALSDVEDGRTLIAFSRFFTSNPDLVQRLKDGLELTPYQRKLFYAQYNWGYNTFKKYGDDSVVDEDVERKTFPEAIGSRL